MTSTIRIGKGTRKTTLLVASAVTLCMMLMVSSTAWAVGRAIPQRLWDTPWPYGIWIVIGEADVDNPGPAKPKYSLWLRGRSTLIIGGQLCPGVGTLSLPGFKVLREFNYEEGGVTVRIGLQWERRTNPYSGNVPVDALYWGLKVRGGDRMGVVHRINGGYAEFVYLPDILYGTNTQNPHKPVDVLRRQTRTVDIAGEQRVVVEKVSTGIRFYPMHDVVGVAFTPPAYRLLCKQCYNVSDPIKLVHPLQRDKLPSEVLERLKDDPYTQYAGNP